jgi:hypothetical protein
MISRRSCWRLPVVVVTLALLGCMPAISELNVSQDTVDHLPRDVALSFLMSLNSMNRDNGYLPCRFGPDGVASTKSSGRPLPYSSLTVRPFLIGSGLLNRTGQIDIFCYFGGPQGAAQNGLEGKLFFKKTVTALLALGVQVPADAKQSIRSGGTK